MNKRSFVDIWLPLSILAALFVFALAQPRPAEAWDCVGLNLDGKNDDNRTVNVSFKYDALSDETVTLSWGDGSSMGLPTGHDATGSADHTYGGDGPYTIELKVSTPDGQSELCKKIVEFTPPPNLCESSTLIEGPWTEWTKIRDGVEGRSRTFTREGIIRIGGPQEGNWTPSGDDWKTRSRRLTWQGADANGNTGLDCELYEDQEEKRPDPDIECKPIEGKWSGWSEWTEWNNSDDGVESRSRTFTREGISKHGNPQYGGWTSWLRAGDWETRSQTTTWAGIDEKGNTGPNCDLHEEQEERRPGPPEPCDSPDGSWSEWTEWNKSDDGRESRSRTFTREGISKHGDPQYGGWTSWLRAGDWETRSQTTTWAGIDEKGNTGPNCDLFKEQEERRPKQSEPCKSSNESWSEWTEWNKSDDGLESRSRTFTREGISKHGDPQYDGWTSWLRAGDWETRSRTITWAGIDEKGNTGPNCDLHEEQEERRPGPPEPCDSPDGSWSEWTEWNKSDDGRESRSRTFTREGISKHGDPQYGGWTSWLRAGDWETRSQTTTWAGIDEKGNTGPKCDLFKEQVERKIKTICENDNCSSPPTCETHENSVRTVGSWSDWRNNDDGTQSRDRSITYQVPHSKPFTCPEIEYREIPAPHLGLCYDPEFELEIRQDPQTGFYRAWRIWTDDNGYQLDELDLFRRFRRFDTVAEWMDASIEPNSRCQFVISLRFEGSDQFDLFRFSSYGSSYLQLTDTPDLNEINPEWTPMMWIDFSEANTLYKIHPNSKVVRAKVINGFHLLGDEIDSSTDPTGRLEVFSAEGNLYILDTVTNQLYQSPFSGQSPTWTPDMTGITVKNGELIFTLDFATGRRTYGSLGQRIVWAPNRWLVGAAHIDYIAEQRYWKEKETGHNVRRTGTPFHPTLEALKSPTLKTLYLEHIKSEMTHKPIDWRIDPKMGQTVNMTPVMEWLATLEPVDLLRTTIANPVGNEPGAN